MSAENYLEALKTIGVRKVVGVDAGYYQGDYFAAVMDVDYDSSSYYDDAKIGLLVIGYGSCSGCDEWEGADSAKERLEILEAQLSSIRWFPNLAGFKSFLASGGASLQWYGHEEEWAEFVGKVNALGDYNEVPE